MSARFTEDGTLIMPKQTPKQTPTPSLADRFQGVRRNTMNAARRAYDSAAPTVRQFGDNAANFAKNQFNGLRNNVADRMAARAAQAVPTAPAAQPAVPAATQAEWEAAARPTNVAADVAKATDAAQAETAAARAAAATEQGAAGAAGGGAGGGEGLAKNVVEPVARASRFARFLRGAGALEGMNQAVGMAGLAGDVAGAVSEGYDKSDPSLPRGQRVMAGLRRAGEQIGNANIEYKTGVDRGLEYLNSPAAPAAAAAAAGAAPAAATPAASAVAPTTEPVPGYNAITADMNGLRRPRVDYNSPTTPPQITNEANPQVQFPVSVEGKPVGYFSRENPNGQFGVRDISAEQQYPVAQGDPFATESPPARRGDNIEGGVRRRGALSVVSSPYGANATPGMKKLLEDADIRAGRALPRNPSAETVAFMNMQGDMARAGVTAASAAKALQNQSYRSVVEAAAQDPTMTDPQTKQLTPAGKDTMDFVNRGAQQGYQFSDLTEAQDLQQIDAKMSRAAQLASSSLNPVIAALLDHVPFFQPGSGAAGEGSTAEDPFTAMDRLLPTLQDLNDPKKTTIRFKDTEVDKTPGFVQRLLSMGLTPELRDQMESVIKRREKLGQGE